jgi:hypothetical protein
MLLVVSVVAPKVQANRVLHGHGLLMMCMHQHGGSLLWVHWQQQGCGPILEVLELEVTVAGRASN